MTTLGLFLNFSGLLLSLYAIHKSHRTGRHVEKHLKTIESYSENTLAHTEQDQ